MSSETIRVFNTPEQVRINKATGAGAGKPAHWVDNLGNSFVNPWPSFRKHGFKDLVSIMPHMACNSPAIPKDLQTRLPLIKPTWGLAARESDASKASETNQEKIKATWLGHACFLVELPVRTTTGSTSVPARGARILFDPVFSDRCSPSQILGPKRFTQPPCKIEDIPEIDAIVISHNHYDHMDTHTLTELMKRRRTPQIFAPLGNGPYFRSLGVADEHVHILDWWEGRRVEFEAPGEGGGAAKTAFDVTCTPAQHFTGRGLTDRFKTLWASWVVQEVLHAEPGSQSASPDKPDTRSDAAEGSYSSGAGAKVYFAGDTGYRAVRDGEDEETVPVCPAFKEIGARWGGFDFAMIPIGAYKPRDFMSPIHCSPSDSVRVFQDVRAKKALGMHWGTWVLTSEEILEPPVMLAGECKKAGIPEDDFAVCDIGQTLFF